MKKAVCLCLSILFIFSLCSCGDNDSSSKAKESLYDFAAYIDGADSLQLSETSGFEKPALSLHGDYPADFNMITKSWLPKDIGNTDGMNNGKNYFAYTFYLKNLSDAEVSYKTSMSIGESTKNVDEALRVMVIKNDEEKVYAKGKASNREEAEMDAVKWKDDNTVFSAQQSELSAGGTDKYTVVVWIEGDDEECVDELSGGKPGAVEMIFSK